MNIFREVADVQTADMLDLDVPALRGGGVDPSVDNFLKITHEARLLGTDARLIDKDAPNNPDGKLNKVGGIFHV